MAALRRKVTGFLQRKESTLGRNGDDNDPTKAAPLIKRFCESAATSDDTGALVGLTEVIFSNPRQAEEGAKMIRKILGDKSKASTGEMYNAAMLISILTRHQESAVFTAHIDDRFVGTIKSILRDPTPATVSTRLLIREMIAEIERTIAGNQPARNENERAENEHRAARWQTDTGVQRLLELRQDPRNWAWLQAQQRQLASPPPPMMPRTMSGTVPQITSLPGPHELAERLTEAESTAQMLTQMVHVTTDDIQTNQLINEFQSRCVGARNSLETYMRLTSDRATLQNIDNVKLKVTDALAAYDAAVRKYLARGPERNTRDFAAQTDPAPLIAPLPIRTNALQHAQNGEVSPIDATAWQDDPFDDRNESRQPATSGTPVGVGALGNRPALSVTNGAQQKAKRPEVPDLSSEPERTSRFRF